MMLLRAYCICLECRWYGNLIEMRMYKYYEQHKCTPRSYKVARTNTYLLLWYLSNELENCISICNPYRYCNMNVSHRSSNSTTKLRYVKIIEEITGSLQYSVKWDGRNMKK